MVFHTAFPLRCCAKGGRKVLFLKISPFNPFSTFFSARYSWCATAPWQRTWSRGSRSTTRAGTLMIKTTFSNSQDWQAGNRCVLDMFFIFVFIFYPLCFMFYSLFYILFFVFYLFYLCVLSVYFSQGAYHEGNPRVHHPTSAAHRDNYAKCEECHFFFFNF